MLFVEYEVGLFAYPGINNSLCLVFAHQYILLSDSISGDKQQQTVWEAGALGPGNCFSLCSTGLIPNKT